MEVKASELIEALGEGIEGRGIYCLGGVFAAIARKAGMPIKSMRLTLLEGPITTMEFKFPKLSEENKS